MAFFNLFKPKWRHADPRVRLRAVANLPATDLSTLCRMAAGDVDLEVRRAALARINDWQLLTSLAATVTDQAIGRELRARIDDLQLAELFAAPGLSAKMAILDAITTESLLARIAVEEAAADIRLTAVARIASQEVLADVVTRKCGKAPALLAIDKMTDETLLRQAAQQAASRSARARAQHKVERIEAERNRPSPEEERQLELTSLLDRVQRLTEGVINEAALQACRQLQRRWREIAGPGEARTLQFEADCSTIRARQQEAVAREEARLAAQDERDRQLTRRGQIIDAIHALATSTAGDEEGRLSALQEEWSALQGTWGQGPLPEGLSQRYDEARRHFAACRTLAAEESATEAGLLQRLDKVLPLLTALELEPAAAAISEAQHAFDAWRPRLVSRQQVASRLCLLRDQHREAGVRREAVLAERLQANWLGRKELLQELQGLLTVADPRPAEQRATEIKDIWRQSVALPAAGEDLEPDFAEACRLLAARFAAGRKEEGWQRWRNKNLKTQLIAEAEALDGDCDLRQVFKRIKELQESWRRLGPAPAKDENALWRGFQQATDRNFARCRAFFKALNEEALRNLQEKMRLRDLVLAEQDSSAWQQTADFIKDVQAQWKAVGPGPKDKEQEVFLAFRAACDHFFERRKAQHAVLDQERLANLAHKEALCQQAEALAAEPDSAHKPRFQELQGAWKAIGPVPRAQEEAIWQRFRAACDRYYAWLDGLRPDNLTRKEALCGEVEELIAASGPDPNFVQVAQKVVALQRRWREIGPVPKGQQEVIWQRFKGSCDAFFAAKARHEEAIDRQRPVNQARKEALCLRLELLAGVNPQPVVKAPGRRQAGLTLAEQLKVAFETNFVPSADEVPGKQRRAKDEMESIKQEWQRIGPVPREHEQGLRKRYNEALAAALKGL